MLSVAYPLAPVGPDAVGGAEQVLSAIDHALVASGHRSLVVACEGSDTAGTLLPIPAAPAGAIDAQARARANAAVRHAVASVIGQAEMVHLHGVDFHDYLPEPGKPVIVTLHLPPGWYPPHALTPGRPHTWFNCVSQAQHQTCPPGVTLTPRSATAFRSRRSAPPVTPAAVMR